MPQLHPRNEDFHWKEHQGSHSIVSQKQAQQYDQDGYFLLEGAFSAEELATVIDAIDPFEQELEKTLRQMKDGKMFIAKADAITFTAHLVSKSEELKAFAKHPVFQKLCRDLIGEKARLYWDQAVYKKPGNPEEFPWHQDNGYTFVEPQQYLTCWVPLVDTVVENGCPWIVPGLHRKGTLDHELTDLGWQCLNKPDDAVAVEAKAGDVVVFSSLTPHRTGPNLTDGVRKSYILQYAPDGVVAYHPGAEEPAPQKDPERQFLVDA